MNGLTSDSSSGDEYYSMPLSGGRTATAEPRTNDGFDSSGSSMASFQYDLGETLIPLKQQHEIPNRFLPDGVEGIIIPRPTFTTNNSLRNLTEQLTKEGKEGGKLPLSPVSKRKSLMGFGNSPYNSPGTLRGRSPGALGGSLHGMSRRGSRSPVNTPLTGGSLHGRPRLMSPSGGSLRGGSLHRRRASSPCPAGSLHGSSPPKASSNKDLSPPSGQIVGSATSMMLANSSNIRGSFRSRSKSPCGPLTGGSAHGIRAPIGGPSPSGRSFRGRSKSPGTLAAGRRSMRSQRRLSVKGRITGPPVSILRKGRFNLENIRHAKEEQVQQQLTQEHSMRSLMSRSEHGSPMGNLANQSMRSSRRLSRVRRVHFWFQDEPSIAPSYETEDSIQFGDLGFEDSGERSIEQTGGRSMRGEMSFIEVMGMDGEQGLNDEDDNEDCDYLVNRFNGSVIHEEFGASFGANNFSSSFGSLLSDDDESDCGTSNQNSMRMQKARYQQHSHLSEDSFALPDDSEEFHTRSPKEAHASGSDIEGSSRNSSKASSFTQKKQWEHFSTQQRSGSFAPIPDLDASSRHSTKLFDDSTRNISSKNDSSTTALSKNRPATPTLPSIGNDDDSISSIVSEESPEKQAKRTSRFSDLKRQTSDSSLDLTSLGKELGSGAFSNPKSKNDSSTSETSSESPTGVAQLQEQHKAVKDSSIRSTDEEGKGPTLCRSAAVTNKLISPIE